MSKPWGRLRNFLWPSQKSWTLHILEDFLTLGAFVSFVIFRIFLSFSWLATKSSNSKNSKHIFSISRNHNFLKIGLAAAEMFWFWWKWKVIWTKIWPKQSGCYVCQMIEIWYNDFNSEVYLKPKMVQVSISLLFWLDI